MINNAPMVRLGELITECDERNSDNALALDALKGISTSKVFIETKANMDGVSLTSYKIVAPREFAYVSDTSRRGDKIALAFNNEKEKVLISSIYTVFRSKDENVLSPEYLYLLFNRTEFDRYSRFNSWGSARETFDWSELCRVKIPLPSIETQRALVAIYDGLQKTIAENEALIKEMESVCHAFVVDCKTKYPKVKLGEWITFYKEKNIDCKIVLEQGININKEFIVPQRSNSDLSSRLIVRKGQFAYCTQLNNENVAIAYRTEEDCVVSPVYDMFEIKNSELTPEYLFLCLKEKNFGRFVYWAATGSAYEFLQRENLCEYMIPLPPVETQRNIVSIYRCLQESKRIVQETRELMKNLCPALVQKAVHSA